MASKPKRIQRKRTKGFRMPENTIYVGRPTKWGNVFIANEFRTTKQAVRMFQLLLEGFYDVMPEHKEVKDGILKHISELKGKNLACWCALDKPCHADVLLEIANRKV